MEKKSPGNRTADANKSKSPVPAQSTGTDKDVSLPELFRSDVRDTLWAEQHLVKSIPKMIDAAGSKELKDALTQHLKVTKTHVARLEKVFTMLNMPALPKKCDAMEGLTISGEKTIESTGAGSKARDAGIIMSGLKVENFEITHYKGLIQSAGKLGLPDIAKIFEQTLKEEMEAEDILAALSKS